ncbi:MAG: hypothetical protein LBQ64_05765 [Bacteroidales bacterium]|jgi:hypothetical protein|nr:hypothetical protein [Bacteroidales bacterium]
MNNESQCVHKPKIKKETQQKRNLRLFPVLKEYCSKNPTTGMFPWSKKDTLFANAVNIPV